MSTNIQEVGALQRAQKGYEDLEFLTKFGLKVCDHYRTRSIRTGLGFEVLNVET